MKNGAIYWNEELGQAENDLVGKKCANLGEMTGLGMPVPEGYALSLEASRIFLEQTGVQEKILELIKPIQSMEYPDEEEAPGITQQINKNVNEIAQKIESAILEPEVPGELRNMIVSYYEELCKKCDTPNVDVAVRSSGVLSMPGQMDTYLNVKGAEEVLRHIKIVWASAFTPRAIAWRLNHEDMDVTDSNIGIAILRMVDAQSAGVGFTANPATGDDTQVIIEGNWGFGESIVQGIVTPDTFQIDKETLEVT
ncbi:MAG: phosphoenolpyruvate synthase, partial [Deltaproteobacteria bacterium]|nr:phosphoenolpyruvate synthase [Deltaproteobacteria bacterium]